MKRKLQFLKTLLVAVGLCVGSMSAWAETITYDFTEISESSLTKSSNLAGYGMQGTYCWSLYYPTELSSALDNQFAFQYRENGGNINEVSVDHTKGGLFVYHKSGRDEVFAITNLYAGDVVTITIATGTASFYAQQNNATYDDAGVETTPAQGTAVTSGTPYTIKGDGILELTTSKSSNFVISKVVIERSFTRSWGMNLRTLGKDISASTDATDNTELVRTAAFDIYYNLSYDDIELNSNFAVNDNANWKIRYKGASTVTVGLWSQAANGTMAIQNLTRGQFVAFWSDGDAIAAGTNVIKVADWSGSGYYMFQVLADGVATFTLTKGKYIYSIAVYDYNNEIIGAMDKSSTFAAWVGSGIDVPENGAVLLQFKNHGSGAENYENWCIGINDENDVFKCNVSADWWPRDAGGELTYAYRNSSDGGETAGWTDWTSFKSDLQDADVALNLTYTDGKLYITGTTTKDDNVYYFNYTYGDGTYTGAKWIVHPFVEKAWLEITSTTSTTVRTTPVHATKVSAGTVGATGYSTFTETMFPLDLSTISGAIAFYAKEVDGSVVKIKSTDATVPAGEGLLLKGTAGAAVTINIADEGTAIGGNLLKGCVTETAGVSGADKYVLVNNSGTAEFQNLGTNPATIPAGKAYLDASGADAPKLSIIFEDDNVTGINAVNDAESTTNEYYDLQGRKVAQPTKGLYIVNGRKVVVK